MVAFQTSTYRAHKCWSDYCMIMMVMWILDASTVRLCGRACLRAYVAILNYRLETSCGSWKVKAHAPGMLDCVSISRVTCCILSLSLLRSFFFFCCLSLIHSHSHSHTLSLSLFSRPLPLLVDFVAARTSLYCLRIVFSLCLLLFESMKGIFHRCYAEHTPKSGDGSVKRKHKGPALIMCKFASLLFARKFFNVQQFNTFFGCILSRCAARFKESVGSLDCKEFEVSTHAFAMCV
jgi:hypothetical protein